MIRQVLAMIAGLSILALTACSAVTPAPATGTPARPTPRIRATPSENDRVWLIPGGPWTTHAITGTVTGDEGGSATLFVQVDGLTPGSPSSGSRSVALSLTCDGAPLTWRYEPTDYDRPGSRSAATGCGETTSVYFSYDANYRRIHVAAPAGVEGTARYTLTAEVHGP